MGLGFKITKEERDVRSEDIPLTVGEYCLHLFFP